jgi:pycsar effector protein
MRARYGRAQARVGQQRQIEELRASELAMEDRLEATYRNLDRILQWVAMADNKALIVLTFQGAMVAGVAWIVISLGSTSFHRLAAWQLILLGILLVVFFLFFCVSLLKSFEGIFPSIRPLDKETDRGHQFFFGTIAAMPLEEFKRQMQSLQPGDIEEGLIQLTHINAQIAAKKFECLRAAVRALGLEMVTLALAALVIISRQVT